MKQRSAAKKRRPHTSGGDSRKDRPMKSSCPPTTAGVSRSPGVPRKAQRRTPSPKRARSSKKRRPVKVWVLRDPEVLRLVFQIFEDLTALRRYCVGEIESAHEVEYVCRNFTLEPDHSGLQRWSRLSKQITTCWGVFDDLARTIQFDATCCQAVYRDLMSIQVA